MKRYTITLGATTTVGGKVTSASSTGRINGALIALEGDAIFCPACKSTGKIVCVEPRIPEQWNGKKVALEDDHCACGCVPPPRLVPNQSLRCQVLGFGSDQRTSVTEQTAVLYAGDRKPSFDDKFILFDADTAYSAPNWTPIPRQTGHLVQRKLDTHSTANWTPGPAQTGHRFRSKLDSLKRPE